MVPIGSFFMEEGDETVTVTADRYLALVLERFKDELTAFCEENDLDLNQQWFQQDGSPRHVVAWLHTNFPGHLVSRTQILPGHHDHQI